MTGGLVYFIGVLGAFAAVTTRLRRSRGVARQQMKWFLFAAGPLLTIPLEGYFPEFVNELASGWVLIGLSTAIGVAVLR